MPEKKVIFREDSYKHPAQVSIELLLTSLNLTFNGDDVVLFKAAQKLQKELVQHNRSLFFDLAPSKIPGVGLEKSVYEERVLAYVTNCRNSIHKYGPKLLADSSTMEQTKAKFESFLEKYAGLEQTKIKAKDNSITPPEVIEAFLQAKKALKEAKKDPVPDLTEPVVVFSK